MLKWILTGLLFAPLMALGAGDDPAKVERDKLQGTWIPLELYTKNGDLMPQEFMDRFDAQMKFDGEMLSKSGKMGSNRSEYKSKFAIDPSGSPKAIHRQIRGGPPRYGIYRIDGDTLEVAWCSSFPPVRPTMLGPCPKESKTKWLYEVWTRKKKP